MHSNIIKPPESSNYECCICTAAFAGSGEHQVCCLPCGHLFGKKCILKWLRKAKSCPQCVAKAKTSDVRVLFTPKVFAVDDSKHEMLANEAARAKMERIDADRERARLTMRMRMVNQELNQWKNKSLAADAEIKSTTLQLTSERKMQRETQALVIQLQTKLKSSETRLQAALKINSQELFAGEDKFPQTPAENHLELSLGDVGTMPILLSDAAKPSVDMCTGVSGVLTKKRMGRTDPVLSTCSADGLKSGDTSSTNGKRKKGSALLLPLVSASTSAASLSSVAVTANSELTSVGYASQTVGFAERPVHTQTHCAGEQTVGKAKHAVRCDGKTNEGTHAASNTVDIINNIKTKTESAYLASSFNNNSIHTGSTFIDNNNNNNNDIIYATNASGNTAVSMPMGMPTSTPIRLSQQIGHNNSSNPNISTNNQNNNTTTINNNNNNNNRNRNNYSNNDNSNYNSNYNCNYNNNNNNNISVTNSNGNIAMSMPISMPSGHGPAKRARTAHLHQYSSAPPIRQSQQIGNSNSSSPNININNQYNNNNNNNNNSINSNNNYNSSTNYNNNINNNNQQSAPAPYPSAYTRLASNHTAPAPLNQNTNNYQAITCDGARVLAADMRWGPSPCMIHSRSGSRQRLMMVRDALTMQVLSAFPCHTADVRDLALEPCVGGRRWLSASMDKTMCMHDLRTKPTSGRPTVLSFQSKSPVWSCSWASSFNGSIAGSNLTGSKSVLTATTAAHHHQVVMGCGNGSLICYDVRKPGKHLHTLQLKPTLPVHSICVTSAERHMVVGSLGGVFVLPPPESWSIKQDEPILGGERNLEYGKCGEQIRFIFYFYSLGIYMIVKLQRSEENLQQQDTFELLL